MQINYPARITPQEGGGFLVQFVDLPDTFTEGQTLEEALFNAAEVLSAMVGWHLDQGSDIPAATPGLPDAHYISPAATDPRRHARRKLPPRPAF